MLNSHEELRYRLTTWMVSRCLPYIDPEITKYQNAGGNSASVHNMLLMAQYSECLFLGG